MVNHPFIADRFTQAIDEEVRSYAYSGANLDYCCSIGLGGRNYTDTALPFFPAEQGDTLYTVSWPGFTVCVNGLLVVFCLKGVT